ncbi:EF-P beta-lysylation protein EpmB [Legionella worsleiensis]|uniref:L-lysine 2,3-aminomutase n=1 Tax=Legionella worsleiensis TaxID=45076 RepID=A0A0W1AJR5_9GAMM|nr:EF-P beta-lysylation protein EpmB [Legionella worsleiensis]KTD81486.1 lysine 2,3-aminomutase [Legionella worsleiensis]STY32045.1 lysine 2,3-aminomutase [Legionella worsleiensis]
MRDTSLSWQKKLAQGFTNASDLLSYLELPDSLGSLGAEKEFVSRIPLSFARRMQKGNPQDPLLLQVLALEDELVINEAYTVDPLDESHTNPLKGLIHKYHGRVLLTVTGVCAVNCRYCFRRHFPYQENNPGRNGWKEICAYIANDPSITEVILSGGDPLLASDLVLNELIKQLDSIHHVTTLRIHSRVPVVFPERIDPDFLAILASTRLKKVVVLHCNHEQELDDSVYKACTELKNVGCLLLNQSVLLKGINDDPNILAALSHALFAGGVLPYYLHLLDKVKGATHFDIPFVRAQEIYQQLQSVLPGYLVPRLAREEPGKLNKTLIF